jgi:hypothetical protein
MSFAELQQSVEYDKMAFVILSGAAKPRFMMKRQHTWMVAGQEILTDWCYHCKIFKAPRVHHCKLCGRCVGNNHFAGVMLGLPRISTTIFFHRNDFLADFFAERFDHHVRNFFFQKKSEISLRSFPICSALGLTTALELEIIFASFSSWSPMVSYGF